MSMLDPVQIAALDFAEGKRGVGWFLQQGLGKTLCALAEFCTLYFREDVDRMIVITPNSFKSGWVDEIEKHGYEFYNHIFRSSQKKKADCFLNSSGTSRPDVLIINYEAIRLPAVLLAICAWAKRGKTYLVIDESIQIKGHRTAQTRAVHRLAPLCSYVRLLTGRPQTQGPHDLWGQLKAIGLYADRNFYAFRGAFCIMGGWNEKEVIGVKNSNILAAAMAPYVFQAKKADWMPSLPRKDYTIRDYQMSPEQLAQYNSMERDFLLYIQQGVITVDVAVAKWEKLAQIQTGFIYDVAGNVHELVKPAANPRLQLLKQLLEEEVEGKCCVVYRHRAVFRLLEAGLVSYNPAHITGGLAPWEIEGQKNIFISDPKCRIILLQADAAKYGHTLLGGTDEADKCRTMIFFENSYSADTRDQIEDRIHRRGQTGESVLYIDLSGSALDRRIVRALQRKERLYENVFRNLKEAKPQKDVVTAA